jgi:osmoprotectant transport system substrate-binding protein
MKRILIVVLAALLATVTACGGDPLDNAPSGDSSSVTVGSANFPESELLAEIYAQALEAKGVRIRRNLNIGSRELYLKALQDGSIDLIPEYTGALLAALSPGGQVPGDVTTSDRVYAELSKKLPEGMVALGQSTAQDRDTLTVKSETAEKYRLRTIEDLKPVAGELVLASPPEFVERYQGVVGLEKVYGVRFKEVKPLDAGGPLTVNALLSGKVQVANIFSTNATVVTNELVVLTDTKNLFLSQNVVPVVRGSKSSPQLSETLDKVSSALTTENLTTYLAKVTEDKMTPATAAKSFITDLRING